MGSNTEASPEPDELVSGREPAASWHQQVAETLAAPYLASVPTLAVDPRTARVVAATPAGEALVGLGAGGPIVELGDRGAIARPDLERIRARTARALARVDRRAGAETAEAWEEQVRLHGPEGPVDLVLDLVLHHRWRYRSELLLITVHRPSDPRSAPPDPALLHAAAPLHTVYDRDARIIAIDPGWRVLYGEPDELVGTLAALLVHPSDLPQILPVAHELFAGRISRCSYTVRITDRHGGWVPITVELRTLAGPTPEERMVLAVQHFVRQEQRQIPGGVLTARETAVVAALFDGLRTAQIADRDGVSVHTVRNQLKSVFRKLGVASQAELLAGFHPPPAA